MSDSEQSSVEFSDDVDFSMHLSLCYNSALASQSTLVSEPTLVSESTVAFDSTKPPHPVVKGASLPNELWLMIFKYMSPDGGSTLRSLSPVCRQLSDLFGAAKYVALTIRGAWQAAKFYETLPIIQPLFDNGTYEPVRYLFITDDYPYDDITRHLDDGTGVPRRVDEDQRRGLMDRTRQTYLEQRGIVDPHATRNIFQRSVQDPMRRHLFHRAQSKAERRRNYLVSKARSHREQRRQDTISEAFCRNPPKHYDASTTDRSRRRYVFQFYTHGIMRWLAPNLHKFASTRPYQTPAPGTIFPKLKELIVPQSRISPTRHGLMSWRPVCPDLKQVTFCDEVGVNCIDLIEDEDEDEENISKRSRTSSGITHVSFVIPSCLHLGDIHNWTHLDNWFVTYLQSRDIGRPPSDRSSKNFPRSVQHIFLLALQGTETASEEVIERLRWYTRWDKRVSVVVVPKGSVLVEETWLDTVYNGDERRFLPPFFLSSATSKALRT